MIFQIKVKRKENKSSLLIYQDISDNWWEIEELRYMFVIHFTNIYRSSSKLFQKEVMGNEKNYNTEHL